MKELRSKIENLSKSVEAVSREEDFKKLIKFIDAAMGQAFKLSGDERANFLITSLLNLRDYMSGEILTKSVIDSSVESVLSIYDMHFEQELEAISNKKKQEESLKEKRQDQVPAKNQKDF